MEQRQDNRERMAASHPHYAEEIAALIRGDAPAEEKKARLSDYHEGDLADAIALLDKEERQALVALLDEEQLSEIVSYLENPEEYLREMSADRAADILENMDADDAIDVLDTLDSGKKEAIIRLMDEEARQDIRLIQSYPEDEIGSRMTTNYIAIRRGLTVKQAMHALVEQAADNDNLLTIYVLEKDGALHGAIDLQDLIRAREHIDLESLVKVSYPFVYADETVDRCIEELKDYSEDSIPVLDRERRLLGVITAADVVEAVDEAMGEDYAKLGGLTAEADLDETTGRCLKKRVPWLVVLMLLGMLVSSVVGIFEPVVAQLTVVVAFQSMILDMAGNVGTQSLAVTIRVLADGRVSGRQKAMLVMRESRVGVLGGLLLGAGAVALIGPYIHFFMGKAWFFSFAVSGCIGLSLMVAMGVSALVGTVMPILFEKIHVDPAVASGPFITTVNDLVAVVTYYGLVWLLLLEVMHLAG